MTTEQKVLIVEDSEAERALISCYLQSCGYRLYHACDGIDGIHKARLLLPDLILLDVDMPHCSGLDACKVLSRDARTRHVPIIFLSAYAAAEQRVQGLLVGAVDYIGKPFDFDEIRLRMAVHMRPPRTDAPPPERQPAPSGLLEPVSSPAKADHHLNSLLFHGARVHLLRQLACPPSVAALARQVGTNEKRLNTAFRHQAGTTVTGYLREERMQEAYKLLQHTQLSVTAIANRVGFSGCANFSTAFRSRFGLSPTRLRQSQHLEPQDG